MARKGDIERKGLKPMNLKDFSGFMVTSNQDAPLKIDRGYAHMVYFDVSPCYRGNIPYFKHLTNIPDAPGVVVTYLLSCDLSDWDPQDIPNTKMKTETVLKNFQIVLAL
jgi:hypothetical protein